jgi:tetratricopeptide (TPR) repeat protein
LPAVTEGTDALRHHFRAALGGDPVGAYRDWFRAQEELRERGDTETARGLADDLWELLPSLPFDAGEQRARFFHNAAVFYGSPGPAADLARARSAFAVALEHFAEDAENGWHARALHNFATALSNLGATPEELAEAVALFERALAWRTSEREIARGVTLHNLGVAWRRLAELDPARASEHLTSSAAALREAVAIRERHGLAEGRALSERHLSVSLALLSRRENAASEGRFGRSTDRASEKDQSKPR